MVIGPKVILYDEPTAGLDPYNTLKIREIVLRLKSKGVTGIFVTHDMPTAIAVCDRFCLLGQGRVLEERKVEDLNAKRPGLIDKFIMGEDGG